MQEIDIADGPLVELAEAYRQRKSTSVLAIIFTDIAGSTQLLDNLGQVAFERLREEYDEQFCTIIEKGDAGCVIKSLGDGALAVFSEPSVAVERCVQVQRELGRHQFFKLRIGIDMGQVSVKSAHGIVRDVFGLHVNRAARIQALAAPGHILTTFHIYDCAINWLTDAGLNWHGHGAAILKGIERAAEIYEVFDPRCGAPQSNDSWLRPTPLFSRPSSIKFSPKQPTAVAVGQPAPTLRITTLPSRLDKDEWDALLRTVDRSPIRIHELTATRSDAPFAYFENEISTAVDALAKMAPVQPSILWMGKVSLANASVLKVLQKSQCLLQSAESVQQAKAKMKIGSYLLVVADLGQGKTSKSASNYFAGERRKSSHGWEQFRSFLRQYSSVALWELSQQPVSKLQHMAP